MSPRETVREAAARLLGSIGLVLLVFVASQYLWSWSGGRLIERELEAHLRNPGPWTEDQGAGADDAVSTAPVPAAPGSILGRLSIARLDITVPLLEGVDDATLLRGAGRVPGTAQPGAAGNVVFAAHRDLHFAHLRYAQQGDHIVLETTRGVRHYRVDSIEIVDPHDTAVLASTDDQLVLITCYPFRWVGPAPQRYLVRALPLDPPTADPPAAPRAGIEPSGGHGQVAKALVS